ncbi:ATP/GTP-binding protein [Streptomyces rubiginosohelvolus]|uniref:ATP/GTP-binding protein n=1 Tax=Streptomyces rubiginosohelvolus TaxID=67362 RepID=UPI0038259D65
MCNELSAAGTVAYTRLDPQPPPENAYWKGHDRSEKGAVYGVHCPGQQGARTVWIADGQAPDAAPVIDPEAVARRAAASMKLTGPAVASPRAAGTYVVGMPMWMWATPSPNTTGPISESATAGGRHRHRDREGHHRAMGDGRRHHRHLQRPRHPYTPDRGKSMSPDCGHLYERTAHDKPGEKYRGTATATWAITWTAPALGDEGTFTETRQTAWTARVGEVQVVN